MSDAGKVPIFCLGMEIGGMVHVAPPLAIYAPPLFAGPPGAAAGSDEIAARIAPIMADVEESSEVVVVIIAGVDG